MNARLKKVPKFRTEAAERAFWATHDSTAYMDWTQAEAALRAQASREARLAFADDVIENPGDLAALGGRVALLHEKYLKLGTRPEP